MPPLWMRRHAGIVRKNMSNKLKKNFDEWAIESLIDNAKNNEHPVLAWKIVAGQKITVEVTFHIIRKFKKEIVVRAIDPGTKKVLLDLSSNAESLNFYLPEDQVLFQTEVKQILDSGDIRIKKPEMIAQADRRKNLRLFIDQTLKVDLEFSKQNHNQNVLTQKFNKRCFDISSGGLSFLISRPEMSFFRLGDIVRDLNLSVDDTEIVVAGKVVNILEVTPNSRNDLAYKAHKISIQFGKMSPENKKAIDTYVFRHVDLGEVG